MAAPPPPSYEDSLTTNYSRAPAPPSYKNTLTTDYSSAPPPPSTKDSIPTDYSPSSPPISSSHPTVPPRRLKNCDPTETLAPSNHSTTLNVEEPTEVTDFEVYRRGLRPQDLCHKTVWKKMCVMLVLTAIFIGVLIILLNYGDIIFGTLLIIAEEHDRDTKRREELGEY